LASVTKCGVYALVKTVQLNSLALTILHYQYRFKGSPACKHNSSQDSCAIAKMTAQCYLYMGALKIVSGLPDYAHSYYSQHFHGFLFRSTLWMFLQNLKSVALSVP